MTRAMLLCAFAAIILPAPCVGASAIETAHLVVSDEDRQLEPDELRRFADKAEGAFLKALDFWSMPPGAHPQKIHVELRRAERRSYSVYLREKGAGEQRSVVRVYGIHDPKEMIHKLTHALFPTPDKLVRNIMGIPTEARLGNPKSFPMCGLAQDSWAAAFRQTGSYIPLRELGGRHEDWGMEFADGKPVVRNRKRQQASYSEAGSFGAFLLAQYGAEKVKEFHRASRRGGRPWREVFGEDIDALESRWLAALDRYAGSNKGEVDFLSKLLIDNAETACDEADASGR